MFQNIIDDQLGDTKVDVGFLIKRSVTKILKFNWAPLDTWDDDDKDKSFNECLHNPSGTTSPTTKTLRHRHSVINQNVILNLTTSFYHSIILACSKQIFIL